MTTPREKREQLEDQILSPFAARSANTRGRQRDEPPCPIRTAFQRDRDRVIHCKAFRRLSHKTQVFIAPEADHYRTRLTHTLEVAQIARTISRALRLNEDLTEAIGLGHDLGHTPFGHTGETALDAVYREFDPQAGFHHAEQSLRVVEVLEKDGQGLNLTVEVRDGIRRHTKGMEDLPLEPGDRPATLEGMVVAYADRIAYINHDIDDAIRAGLIRQTDLPPDCVAALGDTHARRITTMVSDVVEHSRDRPDIRMGPDIEAATNALKDFLYQRVYRAILDLGDAERVQRLIAELFRFYVAHPAVVPDGEESASRGLRQLARRVCDHLAGMTDRFASREFEAHFVPRRWRD
ncbi:MAG: deoxyguanosinetriphosphate triphosphohydrolase [Armatimonadota bacterium]